MSDENDDDVIITKKMLKRMVPYSSVHIGRLERSRKFPQRVRLGENRVGWVLAEVRAWIAERKAGRDSTTLDQPEV